VFDSLLRESVTRSVTEGTGVAGTESFDSITLPELQIRIGDLDTRLHPARVLLKQIGPERCVGNLGLDLLKQADWFKIDFDAMTLELHGKS